MPAAEVVATLTAVAGLAKTAVEILKTAKEKTKSNSDAEAAVEHARESVLALQAALFELQAKALALQEENAELREQIRQEKERAAKRQEHVLKQIGGATVLIREEEPDTYYCPACFEAKGHVVPLQLHPPPFRRVFGSHVCPGCNTSFGIRP